jgi:hypothetical protein
MNEPASGSCSLFRTARGRWATSVPVAREASINWAAGSFSYAVRTVHARDTELGRKILL